MIVWNLRKSHCDKSVRLNASIAGSGEILPQLKEFKFLGVDTFVFEGSENPRFRHDAVIGGR